MCARAVVVSEAVNPVQDPLPAAVCPLELQAVLGGSRLLARSLSPLFSSSRPLCFFSSLLFSGNVRRATLFRSPALCDVTKCGFLTDYQLGVGSAPPGTSLHPLCSCHLPNVERINKSFSRVLGFFWGGGGCKQRANTLFSRVLISNSLRLLLCHPK